MPPLTQQNALIRSANVTASEVAAFMPGGHPYATPESIYDRLMDPDGATNKSSQAMRIGSHMEAAILRFAEAELGFRARANARTFVHPDRGIHLCATPDAFAVTRMPWTFVQERAIVEVKMSGRVELWQEIPPYIEWQCRAQLACTSRDVVYIVVLVAMRLLSFPVYRDLDKEAEMLERVQRFWTDHYVACVRPVPAAPVPAMSFGNSNNSTAPFSFDADPATEKEARAIT